jgi:hypothetical protein
MQSHKLEQRGTIISGAMWTQIPYPQQRICGCGRKIARISKLDHCQRCEDREYAERLLLAGRPRNPPVRVHAPRVHEGPRKPPRKIIGWST